MRRGLFRRRPGPLELATIGPGTSCLPESIDGVVPQLVTIGRDCIVAPRAMLLTHDASVYLQTGRYRIAPVTLGDRVFVGYGAIVLPGVTVGDDAVVGAGSVITHDVPPGAVVAGDPARVVGDVESWLAAHDVAELFEPPYPKTYTPTHEQLAELQADVLRARRG